MNVLEENAFFFSKGIEKLTRERYRFLEINVFKAETWLIYIKKKK